MRHNFYYISKIAQEFWSSSGITFHPSCDIGRALTLSLRLDIVALPQLSLRGIVEWFEHRRAHINIGMDDRVLHGFILIYAGSGIIFINASDSEVERRYTLAHEVSHFILDYKIPREAAINKLGPGIREVLDGNREATINERIDGLLGEVKIGHYSHLIEKHGDGSFFSNQIYEAELNADSLALELLAPQATVIKEVKAGAQNFDYFGFRMNCQHLLVEKFQLPEGIAEQYAGKLAHIAVGGPSILRKLGL